MIEDLGWIVALLVFLIAVYQHIALARSAMRQNREWAELCQRHDEENRELFESLYFAYLARLEEDEDDTADEGEEWKS